MIRTGDIVRLWWSKDYIGLVLDKDKSINEHTCFKILWFVYDCDRGCDMRPCEKLYEETAEKDLVIVSKFKIWGKKIEW